MVCIKLWPVLMAKWSKVLPLTTSCLSLLSEFQSHQQNVASDSGLDSGFR